MKTRAPFFLLIAYLMFTSFVFKSEDIDIWTKQTPVHQAIAFEKSLNKELNLISMNVSLSESIYPLVNKYNLANPVIVKREQTGFLPLHAEYFFSKSDSVIRFISYNWERESFGNFFKKQEMWKEESGKLKAYNAEYEKIKSALMVKLGKPNAQDLEPQITKSDSGRGDYFTRRTTWENDEFHAQLTMIFESMTYRIRWNYYWKN